MVVQTTRGENSGGRQAKEKAIRVEQECATTVK
jgi:hypothetical protein